MLLLLLNNRVSNENENQSLGSGFFVYLIYLYKLIYYSQII